MPRISISSLQTMGHNTPTSMKPPTIYEVIVIIISINTNTEQTATKTINIINNKLQKEHQTIYVTVLNRQVERIGHIRRKENSD